MSFDGLLNKTVSIYRRSFSADEYGRKGSSWSMVTDSYKCRFYKPSKAAASAAAIREEGRFLGISYMVIGKLTLEIFEGDKIIDGSKEFEIRRVYRVTGNSSDHHYELGVVRV